MTTDVPATFARYLAAWNEPDPERVGEVLAPAVSPDVLFVDPANTVEGVGPLAAHIREARVAMPTAEYRLVSGIDGHNRRYRYLWQVWNEGSLVIPGMDAVTVDAEGRLERIDGFFGDFPPLD